MEGDGSLAYSEEKAQKRGLALVQCQLEAGHEQMQHAPPFHPSPAQPATWHRAPLVSGNKHARTSELHFIFDTS